MIYTVTVNPALDLNVTCPAVIRPTTHKGVQEKRHAGGKGIDVSRVIRNLGGTSVAMGFLGGFTGRSIQGMLLEEGLRLDFVEIAEETRTNVIINAPVPPDQKKRDHRFNSDGPRVQPVESWTLFSRIEALHSAPAERKPTHVAICGSLARDMKATYYSNLIRFFKDLGAAVYLDTSKDALKESLQYPPHPDVVKPNLFEFDELIENRLFNKVQNEDCGEKSVEEFLEVLACSKACGYDEAGNLAEQDVFWRSLEDEISFFLLQHPGVKALLVTLGEGGMFLARNDGSAYHGWFTPPEGFSVVSTVGAGDTALAALIWALEDGRSWEEGLRYALAASAGAVTKPGTESPTKAEVLTYLEHVRIHPHRTASGERSQAKAITPHRDVASAV
jgi:fructose-1-phosphate kinase PfkB-like protein